MVSLGENSVLVSLVLSGVGLCFVIKREVAGFS
jgi:hypothetical protein